MNIRLIFSIIFAVFSAALAICAAVAFRSEKEIGRPVGRLMLALIPPVFGNFLVISSTTRLYAAIGCYLYYIGIDFTAYNLLRYTLSYCHLSWPSLRLKNLILILFGIDIAQLLANIVFGHAFMLEEIQLYGNTYYRMLPFLPQNLHRLLVYAVLLAVLIIFVVKMTHSSRIHARRYAVIFFTLVVVIVWCTFYVISRTPLDRSMIGYAVFGLLVFYFSLYYKPLRLLDRILVDISSELPDALFFYDDAENCIWANKEGQEFLHIENDDFDAATGRVRAYFNDQLPTEGASWTKNVVLGEEEQAKYYTVEKQTILDDRGRVDGSFVSIHDDTQMQVNLRRETYRARHDELTELYNRQYLYQRIEEVLAEAPMGQKYDLAYLNVRNFKMINDVFGNAFGDETLRQIADLLRAIIPATGIFGRLAGDMFGVLLPVEDFDAESIEKTLTEFVVQSEGIRHPVLIHVGVYEISDRTLDVSAMFDRARMALSSVRHDFHTHIVYYDEQMRSQMLWEQQISFELPQALRTRQIIPYLQPLVDTDGRVIGAEALVRWIHPERGFLSPATFIPVFERNGMIVEIDRYMWRCACELLASWNDDLFISVNVSPKDFYFADVADELKGLVEEYGISPSRLRIEITESVMITDMENKIKILRGLQEAGFIVEMDDFGSGYSSLNMLKDMPIDVLKIDMVFLRNAEHNEKAAKILRNIINMSTDLRITPLTEGVETKAQYEFLTEMGCKLFQGYYFAKPMPYAEFEAQYVAGQTA